MQLIYEGSICAQSGTVKIDMTRISLPKNFNFLRQVPRVCAVLYKFNITERSYRTEQWQFLYTVAQS